MNTRIHPRDEAADPEYEFLEDRRPPEELDQAELVANAAAEIYRAGKRDDALRFFTQYDQLAGETKGYTSFVWCHATGRIFAIVTHDTNEYRALMFDPEATEGDFEIRIAKREHYLRQMAYGASRMPEQTFYLGDDEVAERLKARDAINLDELTTPEEIVESALARQAWARHEATFGISFQNQRAYLLEAGQLSQVSDAEPLRKLLERIRPTAAYEVARTDSDSAEMSHDDQARPNAAARVGSVGLELAYVNAEV